MTIDSLYPIAGDHAIQSAVVVVGWDPQDAVCNLSADRLSKLQARLQPAFKNVGLTTLELLNHIEIQYGEGFNNAQPVPSVRGFKFSRLSTLNAGVLRSVAFTKDQLVIEIADYTRWAQVWRDVCTYLELIFQELDAAVAIKRLALQFNDVFFWRGAPEELELNKVFQVGNSWLPQNIFQQKSFWHSNHGYLADCTSPLNFRQLDNVNVSRSESDGRHIIQVLTAHQADLLEALSIESKSPDLENVTEIFQKFHDDNKRVLKELLSEAVQVKISLCASEAT